MKICGFTIVRNAIKYGYPVVESIKSILPLCDKMIVAVGNSEDETRALIQSIDKDKISIIDTIWDDSLRVGGQVLAVETNKAMDAIPDDYDWCFYIQADEAVNESSHEMIKKAMLQYLEVPEVEGLLFKYHHFWGTFDYLGINRQWYKNEIRVIRNDKQIRSFRDAQGFRKNNQKLKVKPVEAYIYHYGYVRSPSVMKQKMKDFSLLYHSKEELHREIERINNFNYDDVDAVKRFNGSHPAVMKQRISELEWDVKIDETRFKMNLKDRILFLIEKTFGYRLFEYKNYTIIK
jgi:hypothetical protein